jgi:hypothetical protein
MDFCVRLRWPYVPCVLCSSPDEQSGLAGECHFDRVALRRRQSASVLAIAQSLQRLYEHVIPGAVFKEVGLSCFCVPPASRANTVDDGQRGAAFLCLYRLATNSLAD